MGNVMKKETLFMEHFGKNVGWGGCEQHLQKGGHDLFSVLIGDK